MCPICGSELIQMDWVVHKSGRVWRGWLCSNRSCGYDSAEYVGKLPEQNRIKKGE
jgi:hypothetical protein